MSSLGALHDWTSGALALAVLVTAGLGAALAGWVIMRRDRSTARALATLGVALALGAAATTLGTLVTSTAACSVATSPRDTTPIRITRTGVPAYFLEVARAPGDPPDITTTHSLPFAAANAIFFTGLAHAALAFMTVRSRRRTRSPRSPTI